MKRFFLVLSSIAALAGCDPLITGGGPETETAPAVADESWGPTPSADPNDVWLAFDITAPTSEIHVMRADGSQQHRLELGMSASAPAFSPNGRGLAFAGPGGIWLKDLVSGHTRQLTHGADGVPAWSPDGKLIAFTRDVDIWVVPLSGEPERSYIHGPPPGQAWYANYGHPSFTIDGSSLVFGRRGGIDIGGLDGTNVHPLFVASEGDISMVGVSPDGEHLVISSSCGVRATTFAAAAKVCETGTLLSSSPRYGSTTRASWSDSGLVAYVDGWYGVVVVPATGGTPKTILDTKATLGGAYVGEVSWSRAGVVDLSKM